MRVGILFSSGKDSTNVLWYYLEQAWGVPCLLSLLPKNPDSWMFQSPHKELLLAQAESLGIPIILQDTDGHKEHELLDLKKLLNKAKDLYGIEGVAVGAVASDYQHERVSRIAHELDLKTFNPIWHKDQTQLMKEMIESGFDIRMTRVAAYGLSEEWLGRKLTPLDLQKLKRFHKEFGFHVAGEGGEFETIVLDGPIFQKPITIEAHSKMETEERGDLVITEVR